MVSLFIFVAGVVILIKGNFRLFNRAVSKRDGRITGLILMAPFLLELALAFSLSFAMVSENMVVGENGSFSISAQVFQEYAERVAQFSPMLTLALGVALVGAGFIIYRSPQIYPSGLPTSAAASVPPREHPLGALNNPFQAAPAKQPTAPPAIMTIAEAAAYIHVTPAEIDQMIDQGKLPAARSPGGFRIARSALDDLLSGTL